MNFLKNTKKNIQIKLLKFASVGSNLNIVGFPIYVFNPNVKIGNSVVIYPNVTFFGEGEILIEDNVKIGSNVIIYATKGSSVTIKRLSIIAANSYIIDSNHGINKASPIQTQDLDFCPVEIGADVWVGAGCIIGKGVRIGNGSVIGANSFVNRDVEPYSIVAGSPAKLIRKRL